MSLFQFTLNAMHYITRACAIGLVLLTLLRASSYHFLVLSFYLK